MPPLICAILQATYLLKSVKIKTWFTEEEALKFSTFLFENEYDANMIRCRAPKCTILIQYMIYCISAGLKQYKLRPFQFCDFEPLISRTYVFTGSKRLNKTHFEDESGEQERFSMSRTNFQILHSLKSLQSLKYWMPTLTSRGLLLLSGIHESATSMLEMKCVGDNFGNVGDRFEMSVTDLIHLT